MQHAGQRVQRVGVGPGVQARRGGLSEPYVGTRRAARRAARPRLRGTGQPGLEQEVVQPRVAQEVALAPARTKTLCGVASALLLLLQRQ